MRPSAATLPGPAAAESDGPLATFFRRLRHLEPATLLWVILVAVLLFLVVSPMAKLFLISFETRGTGAFTLSNYFEARSEEHTSELQSLMRISYAVFCLKKKRNERQT